MKTPNIRVKAGEKAVGFLRFKGFGRYDSLTYPQYGNGIRVDTGRVILSKSAWLHGRSIAQPLER